MLTAIRGKKCWNGNSNNDNNDNSDSLNNFRFCFIHHLAVYLQFVVNSLHSNLYTFNETAISGIPNWLTRADFCKAFYRHVKTNSKAFI